MGCPPMIGDLHFHRGYSLRLQESKPLKNNGIISIYGNPQGILSVVRSVILLVDIVENCLSGAYTFDRLSLLHAPQTVAQAVEDIPDGVFARQVAVFPAFLVDQSLP